jgi:ABC-type microcin C transport system permease subunit YejB
MFARRSRKNDAGSNENSEQLALIKMKYGFDKPIATQYLPQ